MSSRSYSLRIRVYVLTGIALVSFLGLAIMFVGASQFISYQKKQEQVYLTKADNVRDARSLLLQIKLLSLTFLSEKDSSLTDDFRLMKTEFLREIERVDSQIDNPDYPKFYPEAAELLESLETSFEVRRQLGLSHEAGQEGRLRRAVHAIEERLRAVEDNELAVKMLMMRRHEKDFMMRLDTEYLIKHETRLQEFLSILATRDYAESDKAAIRELLSDYEAGFKAWAATRMELQDAAQASDDKFGALVSRMSRFSDMALIDAEGFQSQQSETLLLSRIVMFAGMSVFILLSLLATWMTTNSIVTPLRRVANRMLHICEERTGRRGEFTGNTHNEIVHLQNVIGFLDDSLKETDRLHEEVKFHRDNLKTEVAKRTMELEDQAMKLEQALGQEKELNELQNQFVSTVSHEFRTPLTIIDAVARRVSLKGENMASDDLKNRMQTIRGATTRLSDLVEHTLDSAKLAAGNFDMTLEDLNFGAMVRDVVDRHRIIAPDFQFKLQLDPEECSLEGDERLLDHVVSNLVSNAIKYSAKCPYVSVSVSLENEQVVLSVRDHGVGIPKDELPNITRRFFRASTSKGIKGTGIGLNLVAHLIELHHGEFSIDSEEGAWTEVTVRLPIRQDVAAPVPQTRANPDDAKTEAA